MFQMLGNLSVLPVLVIVLMIVYAVTTPPTIEIVYPKSEKR